MTRDDLETNPITIKPETVSHVAEQFWVHLLCCSLPRRPFPIKSLALSARVSLDNSFLSVRQEPTLGPWKESPFLQQFQRLNLHLPLGCQPGIQGSRRQLSSTFQAFPLFPPYTEFHSNQSSLLLGSVAHTWLMHSLQSLLRDRVVVMAEWLLYLSNSAKTVFNSFQGNG